MLKVDPRSDVRPGEGTTPSYEIPPPRANSGLDLVDGRPGRVQAFPDVGDWVFLVLLVLQGQAVRVVELGQLLEEGGQLEVALAEDRESPGVLHVLEVDPVYPLAEDVDGPDGVFLRPEQVAGVEADADLVAVPLDGGLDLVDLLPAAAGPVRVDADGDPVFLGQLVEAVEGVGGGVGREVAQAHRLAE